MEYDLVEQQKIQSYRYNPEVVRNEPSGSWKSLFALVDYLYKDNPEKLKWYYDNWARMKEEFKDYGVEWRGTWYKYNPECGYPWMYDNNWDFTWPRPKEEV